MPHDGDGLDDPLEAAALRVGGHHAAGELAGAALGWRDGQHGHEEDVGRVGGAGVERGVEMREESRVVVQPHRAKVAETRRQCLYRSAALNTGGMNCGRKTIHK